jgi:type IV pilus assembly protein PilQ
MKHRAQIRVSLGALCAWSALAVAQMNEVQSVDYATHPGSVLIRIGLKQPLAQRPSGFRTFHPAARVVLELADTGVAPDRKTIRPERGLVRGIHLMRRGTSTRVVIDLARPATYETTVEGNALLVTLHATPAVPSRDRPSFFGAVPPGGRDLISADGTAGIDVRRQGRRLIVSFLDSEIPPGKERRLDVLDFATPIDAIESRRAGPDAHVAIETHGAFEYSAHQSEAQFTLIVAPLRRE